MVRLWIAYQEPVYVKAYSERIAANAGALGALTMIGSELGAITGTITRIGTDTLAGAMTVSAAIGAGMVGGPAITALALAGAASLAVTEKSQYQTKLNVEGILSMIEMSELSLGILGVPFKKPCTSAMTGLILALKAIGALGAVSASVMGGLLYRTLLKTNNEKDKLDRTMNLSVEPLYERLKVLT